MAFALSALQHGGVRPVHSGRDRAIATSGARSAGVHPMNARNPNQPQETSSTLTGSSAAALSAVEISSPNQRENNPDGLFHRAPLSNEDVIDPAYSVLPNPWVTVRQIQSA